MGTLAAAVLQALTAFKSEVQTWTNQGSLLSIDGHISQIESAVAQDIHAGETAAKEVLGELYGAFHGHTTPATPAEPEAPADPTPSSTGDSLTPSSTEAASTETATPTPETVGSVSEAPAAAPELAVGGPVGPTSATPASPTTTSASTGSSASSSAGSASSPATSAPTPSA